MADDRFILIPAHVRSDRSLRPVEKVLIAEVIALANGGAGCWASNGYLGADHGLSPRTVSRYLRGLVERGYLRLSHEGGRRVLRPATDPLPENPPGEKSLAQGLPENPKAQPPGKKPLGENPSEKKVPKMAQGVPKLARGVDKIGRGGYQKCLPNSKRNRKGNNSSDNLPPYPPTGEGKGVPENPQQVMAYFEVRGAPPKKGQEFYDYYQSIGWVVGKNPVRDWHALANRWLSRIKPEPTTKLLK